MQLADFNRNALTGVDLRENPYGFAKGVSKWDSPDLVNYALDTVHEFNEWFEETIVHGNI